MRANLSADGNFLWLELHFGICLEALRVRTMWGHHRVEGRSSWQETAFFSFVRAKDKAHKLAHAVPCYNKVIKFIGRYNIKNIITVCKLTLCMDVFAITFVNA